MAGRPPKLNFTKSLDQYTATVGGKLHRLGKDRKEAERQFRFLLDKHELSEPVKASPTFGEVADGWLEHTKKIHDARRYDGCRRRVQDFLDHLGRDVKVKDLRAHHVEGWIQTKNLKPGSNRLYKGIILAVLNWGASNKVRMIAANPLKGKLDLPDGESRGADAVWPEGVFETVVANSHPRYVDYLNALAWTGARPSTITKIEARHYNPHLKVWDCEDLYKNRVNKKKYVKRIWLSPDMVKMVERLNKENPTGPIFRTIRGKPFPVDANCLILFKLKRRLARRGTPLPDGIYLYGLRHSFCSAFLKKHPDKIEYLRELMGHTTTATLRRHYIHLIDANREIHDALKDFKPF